MREQREIVWNMTLICSGKSVLHKHLVSNYYIPNICHVIQGSTLTFVASGLMTSKIVVLT